MRSSAPAHVFRAFGARTGQTEHANEIANQPVAGNHGFPVRQPEAVVHAAQGREAPRRGRRGEQ